MATLFQPHPDPKPPLRLTERKRGFDLRDYQSEDVEAIEAAWADGNRGVLCVHATGLGKSVLAAELVARTPKGKRACVIVDSSALAKDLFKTIREHTGNSPGILTGDFKSRWKIAPIVVATKQCLCAMNGETPYYEQDDWAQMDRVVIDECESALADGYSAMMVHILDQNDDLNIVGLTATPLPSGNRNIGDLFPFAADGPGPLYRDLQWAYLNGWLVKPKQAMIRTSMDFSTVTIRKNAEGEKDYSEADLARLMMDQDEREWIELGSAIYKVAKGHTAIVVCPNSTVVADKLAGYIEGAGRSDGKRDIANSIHRSLGARESDDLMQRFTAGEFPVAVSVKMFEKGFNFDRVDMVVIVRRTKSLRLYTQAAGRATRPLKGIRAQLAEAVSAEDRMKIIAESGKPHSIVVDCVGIDDKAKDLLGVIDILGRGVPEDIRERVRQNAIDKANAKTDEDKTPKPGHEDELEQGEDQGDAARTAIRQVNEERERRARLNAKVDVHYEESDVKKYVQRTAPAPTLSRGSATDAQCALMIALGVTPSKAMKMHKFKAMKVIDMQKGFGKTPDYARVREFERASGIRFERKTKEAHA